MNAIKKPSDLKDWLWDKLFLDFYLDKRWTFRFKLMNLISGDILRGCLSSVQYHLSHISDEMSGHEIELHIKRARYWSNAMWQWWRKEG